MVCIIPDTLHVVRNQQPTQDCVRHGETDDLVTELRHRAGCDLNRLSRLIIPYEAVSRRFHSNGIEAYQAAPYWFPMYRQSPLTNTQTQFSRLLSQSQSLSSMVRQSASALIEQLPRFAHLQH